MPFPIRDLMNLRPAGSWPGERGGGPGRRVVELAGLFIPLEAQQSCHFQYNTARSLHAALLSRLRDSDPSLSRDLHDAPPNAPSVERAWTVSGLLGPLDRVGAGSIAPADQLYWVRVTALSSGVVADLQRALAPPQTGDLSLELEGVKFRILTGGVCWTACATFGSLAQAAWPVRRLDMVGLSPTGFRGQRANHPVPDPALCLEGYLRKWNAFSPHSLPPEPLLEYAREHVSVTRAFVRTEHLNFPGFRERGVTGWWRWQVSGPDPQACRTINLLANFSFFCGTGMKTAQGMGQTLRRFSSPRGIAS
ncbi:MAG: CRISPR system precrRNA processing endoribonuclease RAMP protein Cas6 [Dehalococcoidia bacterium]